MKVRIYCTNEDEYRAIDEIQDILENLGLQVADIKAVNSSRYQTDIYGKEVNINEYDYKAESDEDEDGKFTVFDMVIDAEIYSDDMLLEEIECLLSDEFEKFELDED